MTIVYKFYNSLYINLTNRCTNACPYCIKSKWKGKFRGNDLYLKKEPTSEEVIKSIKDPKLFKEIVFCGYGEPLLKLEEVKEISKWIKSQGGKVRINTSGQANLYYKKNILPELKDLVDAVSISLNGTDKKEYNELNKSIYGEKAFDGVIKFIKESKKYIPEVVITAVELPGLDVEKIRHLAKELKVNFRVRPYLDKYETS
ncbi:MAG: TatD family nuclease-associated radical SAM protein [Elusimicrobia bacterium]|nr:TatD family nuclease-associated radical SAM protein [Elusimicrobiota bacterium]